MGAWSVVRLRLRTLQRILTSISPQSTIKSRETNRNQAGIKLKHFCQFYHPKTWQSILNLYKKPTVAKSLTGTRLVFSFLFFSFLWFLMLKFVPSSKRGRGLIPSLIQYACNWTQETRIYEPKHLLFSEILKALLFQEWPLFRQEPEKIYGPLRPAHGPYSTACRVNFLWLLAKWGSFLKW